MLNELERRIITLSYKHKLSHIGSCLSTVNLLDEIYEVKWKDEPFILSNGHAGLALYVILEKYECKDAEYLLKKHGTHPNRCLEDGIYCSTGSLGMGLSVAVGMAIANRKRNVFVTISDGEASEGVIWESLRIASEQQLDNLHLYFIFNGFGAYQPIDTNLLEKRIEAFTVNNLPHVEFYKTNMNKYPGYLQGLSGHYTTINKKQYEEIIGSTNRSI